MTALPSKYLTLAKVGAITFVGAFAAAFAMAKFPTTIEEAKALVLPALVAAIVAEMVYIRGVATKALAENAATTLLPVLESTLPPAAAPVVSSVVTDVVKAVGKPLAFVALCFGLGGGLAASLSACTPTQLATVQTVEADVLAALPVACTIADAVDPSGATIICAILTAAGEVVSTVQRTVASPVIATAIVARHPAGAFLAPLLKARAAGVVQTKAVR